MYQTLNSEHAQTILIIAKLFLVLTRSICSLGLIYFVLCRRVSKPSRCCEAPRQPVGQICRLKGAEACGLEIPAETRLHNQIQHKPKQTCGGPLLALTSACSVHGNPETMFFSWDLLL